MAHWNRPALFVALAVVLVFGEFVLLGRARAPTVETLPPIPLPPAVPLTATVTSIQTTTITIPTYPYADYLEPRYDATYHMTYQWLNWEAYNDSHPIPVPHDYTLLVLENDYLQVSILPELGGRVYQLIYRATGHNELYQNPVIKPTYFGPPVMGWWLAAGGIEWCLPVEEHGYESGQPWTWTVVTATAGVTVTVRDTDAADRLRASIDLFLPSDRGYLMVTPRLENPTGSAIAYKYWTNALLAPGAANAPGAELRFIFNAAEMAVHSTGDCRLPGCWPTEPGDPSYRFTWPLYNGVDFSRLGNWHEWLGFFEYPQAAADFVGVYDSAASEGVARVFPSTVARGAKGFAFGWSNPMDWHLWTDDGSAYVELHGGVAPTFWDQALLPAGASLSWSEYWYPVGALGTLSAATAEAALGVVPDGETFQVAVQPTRAWAARETTLSAWERATCSRLARWDLPAVGPAAPFHAVLPAEGYALDEVAFVYLDDAGRFLAGVNPLDCTPPQAWVEPLPPWVGTTTFTVTWSGADVWQGIAAFDVQVRDGVEGAWSDWLTDTVATFAVFDGVHGHSYFFRARARDLSGNRGSYTDEEWGQAFTTVLTEPAAVLVTSDKRATPHRFDPSQVVSYTVRIRNSGNAPTLALLGDVPPPQMVVLTETLHASLGATPVYSDGVISWSGLVEAGGEVRVGYVLSPTAATPFGVPLTNTATISGSVLGPLTRRETVVQGHMLWLPVVLRRG